MNEPQDRNVRATVEIGDEYRELLGKICAVTRRPLVGEVRFLLDRRAIELGLDPVSPLEPAIVSMIMQGRVIL